MQLDSSCKCTFRICCNRILPICIIQLLLLPMWTGEAIVGKRPYEMDWANRCEDSHPALVDFEDLSGWIADGEQSTNSICISREQQLFGSHVGKFTYRSTGTNPRSFFGPVQPIPINGPFDAISCWIYGNNWGWETDTTTPRVTVTAVFLDANGATFDVLLAKVNWKEWHLCHTRLNPQQIERVRNGASFQRFIAHAQGLKPPPLGGAFRLPSA